MTSMIIFFLFFFFFFNTTLVVSFPNPERFGPSSQSTQQFTAPPKESSFESTSDTQKSMENLGPRNSRDSTHVTGWIVTQDDG